MLINITNNSYKEFDGKLNEVQETINNINTNNKCEEVDKKLNQMKEAINNMNNNNKCEEVKEKLNEIQQIINNIQQNISDIKIQINNVNLIQMNSDIEFIKSESKEIKQLLLWDG